MRLPNNVDPIALWPCRRPVVFYYGFAKGNQLQMRALGARRPVSLGTADAVAVFDSRGRLVTPPPSPLKGWNVARFAPSPRRHGVFLAEVERNCTATGERQDTGRLYVISPGGSRELASYDSCSNPPLALWSPNGTGIFWASYSGTPAVTHFHLSSATGRPARKLPTVRGTVGWALWSPDGTTVAYSVHTASSQAGDVDIATGAIHRLTGIHWTPTPPPRQPPYATVAGWSRDSQRVLLVEAKPNGAGTSVVSVPVAGGKSTVLIRLPQ